MRKKNSGFLADKRQIPRNRGPVLTTQQYSAYSTFGSLLSTEDTSLSVYYDMIGFRLGLLVLIDSRRGGGSLRLDLWRWRKSSPINRSRKKNRLDKWRSSDAQKVSHRFHAAAKKTLPTGKEDWQTWS